MTDLATNLRVPDKVSTIIAGLRAGIGHRLTPQPPGLLSVHR